jgi:hypothetical protein
MKNSRLASVGALAYSVSAKSICLLKKQPSELTFSKPKQIWTFVSVMVQFWNRDVHSRSHHYNHFTGTPKLILSAYPVLRTLLKPILMSYSNPSTYVYRLTAKKKDLFRSPKIRRKSRNCSSKPLNMFDDVDVTVVAVKALFAWRKQADYFF